MTTTYTEALETQCKIMLNIARRLDEKGYAVIVHRLNTDAAHNGFAYTYLLGGLNKYLSEWADKDAEGQSRATRKRPIIVDIWPKVKEYDKAAMKWDEFDISPWRLGKMLSTPFTFRCQIPERVRYKELHSSLQLMSAVVKGRNAYTTAQAALLAVRVSGCVEYKGDSKSQLQILLSVLEMPQHRKILLGQ